MTLFFGMLVAAGLTAQTIWDYPVCWPRHQQLKRQFVEAVREGDAATMRETCEKGIQLLPADPTWRYNLACSLAYYKKTDAALDALEKAIDLGFRDANAIATDTDLKRLGGLTRFAELVEYARILQTRPLMFGPYATVDATGIFGKPVTLGAQNFSWDFDAGCFEAHLKLATASAGGNTGDLYMNRDGGHSRLVVTNFPGLTSVALDSEGHQRKMDIAFPNMAFPYPLFGNCSQAMPKSAGPFWRSIPRALMTTESRRLNAMVRFYLQNQIWVFPANEDCAPVGKGGDVFASVAPYWFVSAGASYTDLPILTAALNASRAFRPDVKAEIVRRGLLAPTIQALVRRSFKAVRSEADYLTAAAHPTAFTGGAIDAGRLKAAAAALKTGEIPPLAIVKVEAGKVKDEPLWPELTYATGCAWAYVLRSKDETRTFTITAQGSEEYAFAVVHDGLKAATVQTVAADAARVTLAKGRMSVTNRVDVAVFGRNAGTSWGAPSYVSFAVVDPAAAYSDPALTPLAPPKEEK